MSDWKGHLKTSAFILGAITALLLIISILNPLTLLNRICMDKLYFIPYDILIGVPIGLYCSLLPDIDIRTSKVFGLTISASLIMIMILAYLHMFTSIIIMCILLLSFMMTTHRGVMHNNYMAIYVGIIVYIAFTSPIIAFYSFCGYLSHTALEKQWH